MAIQKLTLAKVQKACRKAYLEGRLVAQNVRHTPAAVAGSSVCVYKHVGLSQINDKHIGCAIGVALTETTLAKVLRRGCNAGKSLGDLAALKLVDIADGDFNAIVSIQGLHDAWATSWGTSSPRMHEQDFRNAVDITEVDG
jgi:hypothetical protein